MRARSEGSNHCNFHDDEGTTADRALQSYKPATRNSQKPPVYVGYICPRYYYKGHGLQRLLLYKVNHATVSASVPDHQSSIITLISFSSISVASFSSSSSCLYCCLRQALEPKPIKFSKCRISLIPQDMALAMEM